ncbi:putative purine permease 5 [Drosera capensis]
MHVRRKIGMITPATENQNSPPTFLGSFNCELGNFRIACFRTEAVHSPSHTHLFREIYPQRIASSMDVIDDAMQKQNTNPNPFLSGVERDQSRFSNLMRHHIHMLKIRAREAYRTKPISYWILLFLAVVAMLVAFPASSILSRVYYANGVYFFTRKSPTPVNAKLILSYMVLGFLSAADNLMYAYAYAYLPASTSALLGSSSLIFSALFGFLIVSNKLNASIINAIVIITAAMTIIALDSSSDRYSYVTQGQYTMGFMWDIFGSALHGLIFALSELVFVKFLGRMSFHVVLEQQVMVSFFACVFTTIGVIIDSGFHQMASEAKVFKGGPSSYYMVLIWGAITFQLGILGGTAVLFLASTVLAGVLNSVRVPITSIAAVIVLSDPMSGFKILSVVITFWGCICYIYGSSSSKSELPRNEG